MQFDHLTPGNTPIVVIHWTDIVSVSNWDDYQEEESDTATIDTAGWLLEDDPKWVKIAGSYSWEAGQWSDIHTFPKNPPEIEVVKDQVGSIERKR